MVGRGVLKGRIGPVIDSKSCDEDIEAVKALPHALQLCAV
jgi:hypothetical protein